MQIARSKTRDQFPLSEKKIIKKTLNIILEIIIILTFIFIASSLIICYSLYISKAVNLEQIFSFWSISEAIILLPALILLLFAIVPMYIYQRYYFASYFYDLTKDYIIIRKGPITPREITIPYERLQDVYVDQDILDRMFGLYDVHVSSATASSGIEAHIDGLEKPAADGLRALLLQTIQQRISKKKP